MILGVTLWLALATLPGVALLRISGIRWSVGATLAAAPTLGFGLIYVVGVASTRLSLPVIPVTWAIIGALLVAWGVVEFVRWRLGRTGTGRDAPRDVRRVLERPRAQLVAWILVAIGVVGGLVTWTIAQAGLEFPPGWDSMHHGYFVRQIIEYQTLDSTVVLSSTPGLADAAPTFYPLAFNLVAAMIAQTFALPVSQVLLASTIAIGAVFAPITVYAFARVLDPARYLVAGVAAMAAPFVATQYVIIESGRINAVLGLAVMLGTAVVLLSAGHRPRWSQAWVPALAVIGLAALHTSELPLAILAAACVAVTRWIPRARSGWPEFRRWLLWGAGATIVGLLVVLALEPSVLHAAVQRSGAIGPVGERQSFVGAALTIAGLGRAGGLGGVLPVLQLLVLIGVLVPVFFRRWRQWLPASVLYGVFALVLLGLMTQSLGPLGVITSPWYQDFNRFVWSHAVLGLIPAAIALVSGTSWALRRLRLRPTRHAAITGATAVVVLLVFSLPSVAAINETMRLSSAPADADARLVFEQLQDRVLDEEVVLDDLRASGSMWMYADYGVRPLFGNSPYLGGASTSWKERLWLASHLDDIETDECVAALLEKYDVAYVYVDSSTIWDAVPHVTVETLEEHDEYERVLSEGSSAVFAVDVHGGASCDRDVTDEIVW